MSPDSHSVLVVDDNEDNRDLLTRQLRKLGHQVYITEDGMAALQFLQTIKVDLILLDIMMPRMNGYQVLERLRADPGRRHIPVIVISAVNDLESVVRCIEMGAEDYLFKPFNPILLRARVGSCLEKKRLRDQEQAYLQLIQAEQEKSERLLLNILPKPIADRLKQGQAVIADSFPEVTVLFADIVDFTALSAHASPTELVEWLNQLFSSFDRLAEQFGLDKIKTIGDAYMAASGLSSPGNHHAESIAEMALALQAEVQRHNFQNGQPFSIRIGINTGPVVAGVIGTKKFIYDLWGDTVNIASRMESHGLPGCIQVTASTYECLRDKYRFEERGTIQVKGKGEMRVFWLQGRR